jgi:sialidase-1
MAAGQAVPPAPVDVFVSGDGGYHTYRIPALLTTDAGTLLAFAEGRASRRDHARNDIVMRCSTDGGRTWSPLLLIEDAGEDALNIPCCVQVLEGPHAGRVLLLYQRYAAGCDERCATPGYEGPKVCRTFLVHSEDDGRTWSAPREITRGGKPPEATSTASGPGFAIQKRHPPHRGRIVVPFNRGPYGAWKVYAALSDDGGDTWRFGAEADDTQSPGLGNEVQVVELHDGSLLMNSRSFGGSQRRKQTRSVDGGETWSPLGDVPDLIEPGVMASVLVVGEGTDQRVLYAGPRSTDSRVDGTLMESRDGGVTWRERLLLYRGKYAYGVLTRIDADTVGCLFERDGYEVISLVRFTWP